MYDSKHNKVIKIQTKENEQPKNEVRELQAKLADIKGENPPHFNQINLFSSQ